MVTKRQLLQWALENNGGRITLWQPELVDEDDPDGRPPGVALRPGRVPLFLTDEHIEQLKRDAAEEEDQ